MVRVYEYYGEGTEDLHYLSLSGKGHRKDGEGSGEADCSRYLRPRASTQYLVLVLVRAGKQLQKASKQLKGTLVAN
jgi:hypothetical protein